MEYHLMNLTIPNEIMESAHLSEQGLREDLAILLFEQGKITLGQASEIAQKSYLEFQHLLASRKVPIHYEIDEYKEDLATIEKL